MCAEYYELRCMFKKNFTLLMLARAYSVKIGVIFGVQLFSVSSLKDEKLIKKSKST